MKKITHILFSILIVGLMMTYSWARWWMKKPFVIYSLLEWLSPLTVVVSMFAILILLFVCRNEVLRLLRHLNGHDWLLLFLIILPALIMRLTMIPATERVYYDEHAYLQLARGIADEGKLRVASYGFFENNRYHCAVGSYPHWPGGWPTLVGIAMRITNYARWAGQTLNLILSFTLVIIGALLTQSLFGR